MPHDGALQRRPEEGLLPAIPSEGGALEDMGGTSAPQLSLQWWVYRIRTAEGLLLAGMAEDLCGLCDVSLLHCTVLSSSAAGDPASASPSPPPSQPARHNPPAAAASAWVPQALAGVFGVGGGGTPPSDPPPSRSFPYKVVPESDAVLLPRTSILEVAVVTDPLCLSLEGGGRCHIFRHPVRGGDTGAQGHVFLGVMEAEGATHRPCTSPDDTRTPVAVKVSRRLEGSAEGLAFEVRTLQKLAKAWGGRAHPHIVELMGHGWVRSGGGGGAGGLPPQNASYAAVLLMMDVSFQSLLDDGFDFAADLPAYSVCIASALEFIHASGVIHRDVKPANLLLKCSTQQVVLADFATAFDCDAPPQPEDPQARAPFTPAYGAPEASVRLQPPPPHTSLDVWSFSACLLELSIGSDAFHAAGQPLSLHATQDSLAGDARLQALPAEGGVPWAVREGLVLQPEKRPSVAEIMRGLRP